jgi:hypothetical protein
MHASAGRMTVRPVPFEAMLMCMLLEQEKTLTLLEEKLQKLSPQFRREHDTARLKWIWFRPSYGSFSLEYSMFHIFGARANSSYLPKAKMRIPYLKQKYGV